MVYPHINKKEFSGINSTDPEVGLFRQASIYDLSRLEQGKIGIKLIGGAGQYGPPIEIDAPYPLTNNNGLFIGSRPTEGTNIVVGMGPGSSYYFVSYLTENLDQFPEIPDPGELLIHANNDTQIILDANKDDIYLGKGKNESSSDDATIHINTDLNLFASRFTSEHHFTHASRNINGIIQREGTVASALSSYSLNTRIYEDVYDKNYKLVGLDPSLPANFLEDSRQKNPPFVENREIVYEFSEDSDVANENDEASIYSKDGPNLYSYNLPNRRYTKSDTLSLSLVYPNYLIETIKGTAVDIFGNILDLNRFPIPIGTNQATLNSKTSTDLVKSYLEIRELQRKSIAFHFELNARKDLKTKLSKSNNFTDLFGLDEKFPTYDYGRLRSRFFFDIDKEGQFKLNVPASSEKGNVPLLTRYENFSTISEEDNNNPNKLIYNTDLVDIFHDSFAAPRFKVVEDEESSNEYIGVHAPEPGSIEIMAGDLKNPIQDRRYEKVHVKHGTAHHDILTTCFAHQGHENFLNYPPDVESWENLFKYIEPLKNIVSSTIKTSGEDANAGGRSGSLNFDGSLEMSIGANTVDRQSLWLDTAGGVVANLGRDNKNISAAIAMDGDLLLQIGGFGVVGDARFAQKQNGFRGGAVDVRVMHDGFFATMLRIDDRGITIMTPTNINVHFGGHAKITGGKLEVDVEELILQGRGVIKEIQGPSI